MAEAAGGAVAAAAAAAAGEAQAVAVAVEGVISSGDASHVAYLATALQGKRSFGDDVLGPHSRERKPKLVGALVKNVLSCKDLHMDGAGAAAASAVPVAQSLRVLRTLLCEPRGTEDALQSPVLDALIWAAAEASPPLGLDVQTEALKCVNNALMNPATHAAFDRIKCFSRLLAMLGKCAGTDSRVLTLCTRVLHYQAGTRPALLRRFCARKGAGPGARGLGAASFVIPLLAQCGEAGEDRSLSHAAEAQRCDLAKWCLRLLYVMATHQSASASADLGGGGGGSDGGVPAINVGAGEDDLTCLGVTLARLLLAPASSAGAGRENTRHEVKLEVINLLMHAPSSFFPFLVATGCVPCLLDVLVAQLRLVRGGGGGFGDALDANMSGGAPGGGGVGSAAEEEALAPVLMVAQAVAEASPSAAYFLKSRVFPPSSPQSKGSVDGEEKKGGGSGDDDDDEDFGVEEEELKGLTPEVRLRVEAIVARRREQRGKQRNMRPEDAPPGTLRSALINLMRGGRTVAKRNAGELLYR